MSGRVTSGGSIPARIQAIRRDHSRAQIHAVDDDGLEYKLEVPLEAVAGVTAGSLTLSWSIEASAPAPTSTPTSTAARDFQSLMARVQQQPAPPSATETLDPSERLLRHLGFRTSET